MIKTISKIFALLLILVCLLAFVGCSNNSQPPALSQTPNTITDVPPTIGNESTNETPTTPTTPTEPVEPTEPTIPIAPTNPVEPEIPTQPEEPIQPETPTQPEIPTQPETPTQPEEPIIPENPTEPESPEPTTPPPNPPDSPELEVPPTEDSEEKEDYNFTNLHFKFTNLQQENCNYNFNENIIILTLNETPSKNYISFTCNLYNEENLASDQNITYEINAEVEASIAYNNVYIKVNEKCEFTIRISAIENLIVKTITVKIV